jgi:hypothetical protein
MTAWTTEEFSIVLNAQSVTLENSCCCCWSHISVVGLIRFTYVGEIHSCWLRWYNWFKRGLCSRFWGPQVY